MSRSQIHLLVALFVSATLPTGCIPAAQSTQKRALTTRLDRAREDRDVEAIQRVAKAQSLDRRDLVRAVLAQNPTLDAARHAWREALAQRDAVSGYPDPVLAYSVAPGSFFDPSSRIGQQVRISQTIPWGGKLDGAGQRALHQAEALAADHDTARLDLALRACRLFDRYYVIDHALRINRAHHSLVAQLEESVRSQYVAGKAKLHHPLDVLATLEHLNHAEHVWLAKRDAVVAELNALLHRLPTQPLPPPPRKRATPQRPLPAEAALYDQAIAARSELEANRARQRAAASSIDLAQRAYKPDFTVSGTYNGMWPGVAHQFMVGVSAAVPISVSKRAGAEKAAQARRARVESEGDALRDRIRLDVHRARARLLHAQHVIAVYDTRLVPLAERRAAAVRTAYVTGDASLAEVLAAERARWSIAEQRHQAIANATTRTAELDRSLGRVPGLSAGTGGDR